MRTTNGRHVGFVDSRFQRLGASFAHSLELLFCSDTCTRYKERIIVG